MKIDQVIIANTKFDRRIKICDMQKQDIRSKYVSGLFSLRYLGREYGVDKCTIKHIVDEVAYSERKDYNKEYIKSKREQLKGSESARKANAESRKSNRDYKRSLLEKGLL